jgi:hypothetical protein
MGGSLYMSRKNIREYNATRKERQELFSQAGERAINAARAASLPLTYVEGTNIIRENHGKKTIIGTVSPRIPVIQKKYKL